MASNLRDKAEQLADKYFASHGDSKQALVATIHAALVEVVEQCAKVADGHIQTVPGHEQWPHHTPCFFAQGHDCAEEVSAAIRALHQQGVEHG